MKSQKEKTQEVKLRVVVIDDDEDVRYLLTRHINRLGHEAFQFATAEGALKTLFNDPLEEGSEPYDLVFSDVKMEGMDGIHLAKLVHQRYPSLPVVLITAYAQLSDAVKAIRAGAQDYIEKPFRSERLDEIIENTLKRKELLQENERAGSEVSDALQIRGVRCQSHVMQEIYRMLTRVARVDSSVMITGESGVGKEVIARAIHENSPRSKCPFVAVNCSAIPSNLLESELFGYLKGAFTGADTNKRGLFEQANGGSIFLDEIGDMDPTLQVKLLRVLQERCIRPLGGSQEVPIDVRVISATHQNIEKEIEKKHFREDLFYRLNVIPIFIPPLRHRRRDIPALANYILEKRSRDIGIGGRRYSEEALRYLMSLDLKGNVRELENLIERALIFSDHKVLDVSCFSKGEPETSSELLLSITDSDQEQLISLAQLETKYILHVLKKCHGEKQKAAQCLEISRRTLYRKLQEIENSGILNNYDQEQLALFQSTHKSESSQAASSSASSLPS